MHRAPKELELADEIGFRPIIVGGHEAWMVADELADRGIPVLIGGLEVDPRANKHDRLWEAFRGR